MLKTIAVFILFYYLVISSAFAQCQIDLKQTKSNYIETLGPEDSQFIGYQLWTTNGGKDDGSWKRNPYYALVSKKDCNVLKLYKMPSQEMSGGYHLMILNKVDNTILIISWWTERPSEINEPIVKHNELLLIDYLTLNELQRIELPVHILHPKTRMLLSPDSHYLYHIGGGNEFYKLNISELSFESKYVADEEFYNENALGEFHQIAFARNVKSDLKKNGAWNDFREQPLLAISGKDSIGKPRRIDFSLSGQAIRTLWYENGEPISNSPSAYEKKFNVKIKPLTFVALSSNIQGKKLPLLNSTHPNYPKKTNASKVEITNDNKMNENLLNQQSPIYLILYVISGILLLILIVYYILRKIRKF